MSKLHYITPTVPVESTEVVRLGTNAKQFAPVDANKFVKLSAESAYALCAQGDPIEAIIASVETAGSGGFSVGGIWDEGTMFVTADGLEATPGVGAIAIGDYVVCGTVVALGMAVSGFAKVCKATNQPGVAYGGSTLAGADTAAAVKTLLDVVLAALASAEKNAIFGWRVVSLGSAGTGAVGTQIVVERVGC